MVEGRLVLRVGGLLGSSASMGRWAMGCGVDGSSTSVGCDVVGSSVVVWCGLWCGWYAMLWWVSVVCGWVAGFNTVFVWVGHWV